MENLINDICEKTGIDRATAEKVAGYLKDNMGRIPTLLQGGGGGLKGVAGKVGDVLGH
jgi:hypothetical protein